MYGRLRVRLGQVNSHGDIVVRKMEVTTEDDESNSTNPLRVTMIQLISWPQQGLPPPKSILSLIDHLTVTQMKSSSKETVVMCRSVCCSVKFKSPPYISRHLC